MFKDAKEHLNEMIIDLFQLNLTQGYGIESTLIKSL